MTKSVVWSPLAEGDLELLLNYLHQHWNTKVVTDFLDMLDSSVQIIATNPRQFPLIHSKKNIRKFVLTKHNSIYFSENNTTIFILRIYDTRQNPKKLKL